MNVEYGSARPAIEELQGMVVPMNIVGIQFTPIGEKGLLIRSGHLSEEDHQRLLLLLQGNAKQYTVTEKQFDSIGPTIGHELRVRSAIAVVLVILLIVLYVAWAFRKVSRPVPSWKYGIVTIVALLHDVILPAGFFAILGKWYGVEVDTLFVTAILTILGFSVHDTIVVFDRIRENLRNAKKEEQFEEIVNQSLLETITRSVNTSFTVLLALTAVFLFGGESVRFFSLTLIAGIIFGTYSSIFIASPLLVSWYHLTASKEGKHLHKK